MKEQKKTSSAKRTALITLCIVLFVVLAVLIAALLYVDSLLSMVNRTDPNESSDVLSSSEIEEILNQTDFSGTSVEGEGVEWGDGDIEPIPKNKDIINILLIGQDKRPGETRARSDSMILCTINKSTKTVTMSSFMRDMYVQIPGYQDNRINVSYALGGIKLLNECIYKNFGVQIDGNVEIDFSGFRQVIDLLGGIKITLTQAEADYLNRRGNWDIEDNAGEWSLVAGENELNGSQALAYSRIRDVGNADFGRTNRQRVVLSVLLEKAKSMSVSQINGFLNQILPLLTTDLSNVEILSYTAQILPMLSSLEVDTQQIPANGAYKFETIRGMDIILPDLKANRDLLAAIME